MMPLRRIIFLVCAVFLLMALAPRVSSAAELAPGKKAEFARKAKVKAKKGKTASKKAAVTTPPGKGSRGKLRRVVSIPAGTPPKSGHGTVAIVKEMRHWSNPDYTRIAITIDREVKFEPHQLPLSTDANTPSRIYIDISAGRIGPGVRDIQIGDGLLKTARIAQYRPDTVRVVLDLGSIKEYKIFTFSDPFSIIIDVKGARREEISRPKENVLTAVPAPAAAARARIPARPDRPPSSPPRTPRPRRPRRKQ